MNKIPITAVLLFSTLITYCQPSDTIAKPEISIIRNEEDPIIYWNGQYSTGARPATSCLSVTYTLSNDLYKNKTIKDSLLKTQDNFLDYANDNRINSIIITVVNKNSIFPPSRIYDVEDLTKKRKTLKTIN